jgi:serine/threonine protein kinase
MRGPVQPGEVIAGKYRVERKLGAGAMGVVVSATHLKLEQRVAIKLMLDAPRARPDLVARFVREGRASAKIKGEHVARVLDVGELDGGTPYIVMEYLEGVDLAALLKREGAMEPSRAVGYVLEACEAVGEAHSLGIVHRDLKPANLFLATLPGGARLVKVLDFGVSKAGGDLAASGLGLTSAEAMLGSPLYTSPEQLRSSRDADARSDLWSLGVILYELLAGRTPFRGDIITELLIDIMTNRPPPIGRAGVPPELEAAVLRCLRRPPEERFADVAEFAAALAPFGPPGAEEMAERVACVLYGAERPRSVPPRSAGSPRSARPVTTSAGPTSRSIGATAHSGAPGPGPEPGWRGPVTLVAFAGALVGLVAIATIALLRPAAPRATAIAPLDAPSARATNASPPAAPPPDPAAPTPAPDPTVQPASAPAAVAPASAIGAGEGAPTAPEGSAKAPEAKAAPEGPGKRPPKGASTAPPSRPNAPAARPPVAAPPTAFDMPIK